MADIALLFTHRNCHRQGIVGTLWAQALMRCRQERPALAVVSVTSSPYAVVSYRRMGFAAVGPEKTVNGEVNLGSSDPWTVTVFTQAFSTLGLIFLQPPARVFAGGVSGTAIGYAVLIAVLCSIIPFYLLLRGISLLGGSRASIISTVELPAAVVLAWLILGDVVTPWNIAGGILILASTYILQLERTEAETAEPAAASAG